VVHQPDHSRAARVADEAMGGHVPHVWISDRYSAQQKHGARQQTCLAHLARDTAFALVVRFRRLRPVYTSRLANV
jgi:transposase